MRQQYEGKAISTKEMMDVFAAELPPSLRYEGKGSLDWFLDGWVNGISVPKLELKSVKITPKGAGLTVSGTILQKDAPEDLVTSVPVYAVAAGKQMTLMGRVFADGQRSSFRLAAPAGTKRSSLIRTTRCSRVRSNWRCMARIGTDFNPNSHNEDVAIPKKSSCFPLRLKPRVCNDSLEGCCSQELATNLHCYFRGT